MDMATRTMPVEEFEAHCLSLVDEVAATGDEIVITRQGRAVATLLCRDVPHANDLATVSDLADGGREGHRHEARRQFPDLRGTIEYEGDLVAPLGIAWAAAE